MDGNGVARSNKVAGTEKNTSQNTPFKNIDFSGKTERTFTFAIYNGTNAKITLGASYDWATYYSSTNEVGDDGTVKDSKSSPTVTVNADTYSKVSLTIPSGVYWNNSGKIDGNGSNGKKVDGSV